MKTAAVISALMLACACPAGVVTTTADSGPGSLRDAILNAVAGETITFSVTGSITLTTSELIINKDLNISGPGAANLAVQRGTALGTPAFRIFNLQAGIVSISGLAIENGSSDDSGGGINVATTATIRDCWISGSFATASGAGINNLSTLVLSNCVIQGNVVSGGSTVSKGGGINNAGTLTAIQCVISSNSVTGGAFVGGAGANGNGGGINNNNTLTLTNSLIYGNTVAGGAGADGAGGGVFSDTDATLDTCTVAFNSATGGAGSIGGTGLGGGIANDLGTVVVNRSTVSGNSATGGAGGNGSGGAGQGGGISIGFGTFTLESSTLSGNQAVKGSGASALATPRGAGLFNGFGSLAVLHSTITANNVTGASSTDGGGLLNSSGFLVMTNTIVAGNSAPVDFANGPSASSQCDYDFFGTTNGPIAAGSNNLSAANAKLGPLQNNGGPTFTHALLCGSPAINAGSNSNAPATDQRGFPRIVDGTIDIGAFEYNNLAPTITCPNATTNCSSAGGRPITVAVSVSDPNGDPLVVIWTVNGAPFQTNALAGGTTTNATQVDLTANFAPGMNLISVSVTDPSDCSASCSTALEIQARGNLYPIALSLKNVQGVAVGAIIPNIYNGVQPGNFGWLTWAGSPSEPTLATSLTPPGNSSTYVNPLNHADHVVSIGDWVQGKPGVTDSYLVRKELDVLEHIDIVVPVYDRALGSGNKSLYHVAAFARVRILNYRLPNQNRITARFLGFENCN